MSATHYVQFMEFPKNEAEAREAFTHLQTQDGYKGGRVMPPGPGKPWRVQAFFEDAPVEWLPDGCSRVLVLDSMRRTLGIHE